MLLLHSEPSKSAENKGSFRFSCPTASQLLPGSILLHQGQMLDKSSAIGRPIKIYIRGSPCKRKHTYAINLLIKPQR